MSDERREDPAGRTSHLDRPSLPKRFYKTVSIAGREEGHVVLLDGRPLRTPKKRPMAVSGASLARALAGEWERQSEFIDPATMPITRMVTAGIDIVGAHRQRIVEELASYIGTDLLCYRADRPETLAGRQRELWDPVLRWAEDRFGMRFTLVEGLMPVDQPPETLPAAIEIFSKADDITLAGLHATTTLLGSAVLAIAHWSGHLSTEQAWDAAHVDENWNFETWGEDQDALARRAKRWQEMRAAAVVIGVDQDPAG